MGLSVVLGDVMGQVKGLSLSVINYSEGIGFAWDGAVYNAVRKKADAISQELNSAYKYIDKAQNTDVGFDFGGKRRNYEGAAEQPVQFTNMCVINTGNEWIHVSQDAADEMNAKARSRLLPYFDSLVETLNSAKSIRTSLMAAYEKLDASIAVITPKLLKLRLDAIDENINNAIKIISSCKDDMAKLIQNTDKAVASIIDYDKSSGFYLVRDALNRARAIPDDSTNYDAMRESIEELGQLKGNDGYMNDEINDETLRLEKLRFQQKIDELREKFKETALWDPHGNGYGRAWECMGFAFLVLATIHDLGNYSNIWMTPMVHNDWEKRTCAGDVQIGDYVRYNSGYNDHSIVIIGVENGMVQYIHANVSRDNAIHYDEMSIEQLQQYINKTLHAGGKGFISHP